MRWNTLTSQRIVEVTIIGEEGKMMGNVVQLRVEPPLPEKKVNAVFCALHDKIAKQVSQM
jgi:hypothetical protein